MTERSTTSAVDRADDAEPTPAVADRAAPRTERGEMPAANVETEEIALLADGDLKDFRAQWERVQIAFVDQPREAVQQAHELVDQVVDHLTHTFTQQRNDLEGTWTRGDDVSTEDLRLTLQRYRSFFNRLLST